jgi:hypothetical protein
MDSGTVSDTAAAGGAGGDAVGGITVRTGHRILASLKMELGLPTRAEAATFQRRAGE